MSSTRPVIQDGSGHETKYCLSVEDPKSVFQHQRNHCLYEAQSGRNINLNFASKSGELVSAHQALILPRSTLLQHLVESSESCGCAEDVPTVLLPDWEHQIIHALVCLLYSGSVCITENLMEELLKLMHELCLDIPRDQLLVEPVVHSICGKSRSEEASVDETQVAANSTSLSENPSGDKSSSAKIGWMEGIRVTKVEAERANKEQERMRKKLSEAVDFLGSVQIKTEESLDVISKPLDDLVSALKYLPTEPSFDCLPTEIKTNILGYLCNLGAFVVASVCREWKEIVKKRLTKTEIKIGKHCTNTHPCENGKCFLPVEILKASTTLKLDVCLKICYPVKNVDSALLAEGLTSVPKLRIIKQCRCGEYAERRGWGRFAPYVPQDSKKMLTQNQMKQFIETLEQKNEVLKSLELNGLSMIHLDQEKLINSLLKIDRLFLGHGSDYEHPLLNGDVLIDKLLKDTTNSKITEIYMERLECPNRSPEALANALCRVESVYLGQGFPIGERAIQRVIYVYDVLSLPIRMENFFIFKELFWAHIVHPDDLNVLMNQLKKFAFYGYFSSEQEEGARSIPEVNITTGVKIGSNYRQFFDDQRKLITKGIVIDTSSITSFDLSQLFFNE